VNFRLILAGRVNYFNGNAVGYHYEKETANESAERIKKKAADLGHLLGYVKRNSENPAVMKHIEFMYA
jgi:hypothetical protein